MEAVISWVGLVIQTACSILLVCVIDYYLYLNQESTVTHFLRQHPLWFFAPIVILDIAQFFLAWHLFVGR